MPAPALISALAPIPIPIRPGFDAATASSRLEPGADLNSGAR
jgi:hypothetical protein